MSTPHRTVFWRVIQKRGLTDHFRDSESEIGKVLNLFFILPLLPTLEVINCFVTEIVGMKLYLPNSSTHEQLDNFVDYVLETNVDPCSLFPITIWADFNTVDCITNYWEFFNVKLNKEFNTTHLNVLHLIEVVKSFQDDTYMKMKSTKTYKVAKRRIKRYIYFRLMLIFRAWIKICRLNWTI